MCIAGYCLNFSFKLRIWTDRNALPPHSSRGARVMMVANTSIALNTQGLGLKSTPNQKHKPKSRNRYCERSSRESGTAVDLGWKCKLENIVFHFLPNEDADLGRKQNAIVTNSDCLFCQKYKHSKHLLPNYPSYQYNHVQIINLFVR